MCIRRISTGGLLLLWLVPVLALWRWRSLQPAAKVLLVPAALAPLVFLAGEGTELYRGVGVIVMFGLLGTALVSLTFLPALTVFVLQRFERRQAVRLGDPGTA